MFLAWWRVAATLCTLAERKCFRAIKQRPIARLASVFDTINRACSQKPHLAFDSSAQGYGSRALPGLEALSRMMLDKGGQSS